MEALWRRLCPQKIREMEKEPVSHRPVRERYSLAGQSHATPAICAKHWYRSHRRAWWSPAAQAGLRVVAARPHFTACRVTAQYEGHDPARDGRVDSQRHFLLPSLVMLLKVDRPYVFSGLQAAAPAQVQVQGQLSPGQVGRCVVSGRLCPHGHACSGIIAARGAATAATEPVRVCAQQMVFDGARNAWELSGGQDHIQGYGDQRRSCEDRCRS